VPFIETAVLGSSGASVFDKSGYVQHLGLVRIQVRGAGVLRPTTYSMDEVNNEVLSTITMASTTNEIKESKSNFKEQQMNLRLETTSINEIFRISKITFFIQPLWASLPG